MPSSLHGEQSCFWLLFCSSSCVWVNSVILCSLVTLFFLCAFLHISHKKSEHSEHFQVAEISSLSSIQSVHIWGLVIEDWETTESPGVVGDEGLGWVSNSPVGDPKSSIGSSNSPDLAEELPVLQKGVPNLQEELPILQKQIPNLPFLQYVNP